MPTPIGHSIMGGILYRGIRQEKKRWGRLLLYLVVANLADFDFIPGIVLGKPNFFHHGPTHSLGAALLVGLFFGLLLLVVKKENFWLNFFVFSGIYFFHIVLDYFAVDTTPPYGIPLFWPLVNDYFISPIQIFSDISRGSTNTTFFSGLFLKHNWFSVIKEILILTPILALIALIRNVFDISKIDWRRHNGTAK